MYQNLTQISRPVKRALILAFDASAVLLAVTLAIVLRLNDWPAAVFEGAVPFYMVALGLCLVIAPLLSIPQTKLSAFDMAAAAKVGLFAMLLTVIGTVLNLVLPEELAEESTEEVSGGMAGHGSGSLPHE